MKKILSAFLTLCMVFSCVAFAEVENANNESASSTTVSDTENGTALTKEQINKNATGFTDVSADDSYASAVKKLLEYGIIEGYKDGTFRPYDDVTRAEMCKMINLTRSYTDFEGAAGFTDMTSANWYYIYALVAQKTGYIEGYEDGSFRAGNNITRQEVCAILNRILKPMNLGIPVTISDNVANWARPHVEVIVQNYIMPLEENNTFRATENLKRHELATILANIAIGPVTPIDADVRFFINGEQYGETQTVAIGASAMAPEDPNPSEEGYVFVGWKPIGGENIVDVKSEIVYQNVDYEAIFEKKTCTVTFMSRGAEYDVQKISYNSIVSAPENPTVKGYEFLGWSLSEDGEITKISATKIVSDTVFYAVFTKESNGGGGGGGGGGATETTSYSVKFFVNGDTYNTQTVNKNSSPKVPTSPKLDGYEFEGWSLKKDGEIVDPESVKVTSNVTFYAVFSKDEDPEPVKYTVTFYVDGKKYDTQTVEEGTAPEAPENPQKDDCNFKGWSKTSGSTAVVTLSYCKINSDTSFYAVFEKKQEEIKYYTVSFYSDGKLYHESEVESGKSASAPANPKMDGYTFKGWSKTDGGNIVSVNSVEIVQNTSFYAVFEKNEVKKYSVVFYVDSDEYDRQTVEEGKKPKLPSDPDVDGYSFKGWAKTKGGTSAVDVESTAINAETNYYAILEKDEEETKKITVTFMVSGKKHDSQTINAGEMPSVPEDPAPEDGYEFLGWSKTENGTTVMPDKIALNKDTTYYAVFEEKEAEIKYFTVIFWLDGEFYTDYKEVAENDYVKAPKTPTLNSGESFLGWSTKEDGKEKDVVDVSTVKITKDTDFYAVLIKNPNDPELMEMLNKAYVQLNIRTGGLAKQALNTIRNCVEKVINDAEAGEYITKNYILDVYEDDVEKVKEIVNEQMTSTERSNFINTLTNEQNIEKEVQDFLIEYFDIDTNI